MSHKRVVIEVSRGLMSIPRIDDRVALAIAADSTVTAAAAAAIDAEPRVAANTAAITRVDPGTTGVVGQSLTIGPSGPVWMDEPVFNVKHPRFGAIGNTEFNAAGPDDTPAIQAAIDAAIAAGGGIVLIPKGRYRIDGTLKINGTRITIRGIGKGPTFLWKTNAGSLFELTGVSNAVFENFTAMVTSGHIFDAITSAYFIKWSNLLLKQYALNKSIFHMDDTLSGRTQADYVDNVWDRVESIHELAATEPAFKIRSYAANRNRWIDCRPMYSGNYHYWIETTHPAGGPAIGNVFEGITGEVLNGGAFKILGGEGTRISDFDNWDMGTTTNHGIYLGASQTNGTKYTKRTTITNTRRVGGTLGSGLHDLKVESSGGNIQTILINCGGAAPFSVDDFTSLIQIGGSVTYKWGLYVTKIGAGGESYFDGTVRASQYTTATRPAANTVGAGAMIWNTTTNKPNYSDGTNWRDAAGAIV